LPHFFARFLFCSPFFLLFLFVLSFSLVPLSLSPYFCLRNFSHPLSFPFCLYFFPFIEYEIGIKPPPTHSKFSSGLFISPCVFSTFTGFIFPLERLSYHRILRSPFILFPPFLSVYQTPSAFLPSDPHPHRPLLLRFTAHFTVPPPASVGKNLAAPSPQEELYMLFILLLRFFFPSFLFFFFPTAFPYIASYPPFMSSFFHVIFLFRLISIFISPRSNLFSAPNGSSLRCQSPVLTFVFFEQLFL